MKIKHYLNLLLCVYIAFSVGACKNENIDSLNTLEKGHNTPIPQEEYSENNHLRAVEDKLDLIDELALEYYTNLKAIVYATSSLKNEERPNPLERHKPDESAYERIQDNDEKAFRRHNPVEQMLNGLDIVDENDSPMKFKALDLELKIMLVDHIFTEEAVALSHKLERLPELRRVIEDINSATSRVIRHYNVSLRPLGLIPNDASQITSLSSEKTMRFFEVLEDEIAKERRFYPESSGSAKPVPTGEFISKKVSLKTVKTIWARNAKVGNILLALPVHNMPWTYVNVLSSKFTAGHAGIINRAITSHTNFNDSVTIECNPDPGVAFNNIENWGAKHYILGLQKIRYKLKWNLFWGLRLVREVRKINNPAKLAVFANKFRGRKYVRLVEFPIAKWQAPKRFTCTSLVWWAAKKTYGLNVSYWWSPLVSPSAIYLSPRTYIIANVE